MKDGLKLRPVSTLDHQVAFGTTKGSRHFLKENPSLKIFKKAEPGVLDGPMFFSNEQIGIDQSELLVTIEKASELYQLTAIRKRRISPKEIQRQ